MRADKGGENTSAAFRKYCLNVGIKLEFASTNTPQQIGANERLGRTLAGMVRCLLSDSGLPPFLWGELFLTASYLSNRAPHAALGNKTLSVAPDPDLMLDEGTLEYHEPDDLVRDVRNYATRLGLGSSSDNRTSDDVSVRQLLEQLRDVTDRDLRVTPARTS